MGDAKLLAPLDGARGGEGSATLREAEGQPVKLAKLLLLSSAKGGSAKTTTARNLAVIAAQAGLRVATIDLDGQESLTRWWKKRPDEAPAIQHYRVPIE